MAARRKKGTVRACCVCGCTDVRACKGGCSWTVVTVLDGIDGVEGINLPPLCSTCAPRLVAAAPKMLEFLELFLDDAQSVVSAKDLNAARDLVAKVRAR